MAHEHKQISRAVKEYFERPGGMESQLQIKRQNWR